jgi:hypothetical protein
VALLLVAELNSLLTAKEYSPAAWEETNISVSRPFVAFGMAEPFLNH